MLIYPLLVLHLLLGQIILGQESLSFFPTFWILNGDILEVPELWNFYVHHYKVFELTEICPIDGSTLNLREVLNLASVSDLAQVLHEFGLVSLKLFFNHLTIPLVICKSALFEFFSSLGSRGRFSFNLSGSLHLHVRLKISIDLVDNLPNLNEFSKCSENYSSHETIEAGVVSLTTFSHVLSKFWMLFARLKE